ncbi:MAG: twin-arginine translocation signal domain-containing protein, partial [Gemmatimonadales bacterium]
MGDPGRGSQAQKDPERPHDCLPQWREGPRQRGRAEQDGKRSAGGSKPAGDLPPEPRLQGGLPQRLGAGLRAGRRPPRAGPAEATGGGGSQGEGQVSNSPSRRDFLAATAAAALAAAQPARTQPVKRPNLVFVFADQLRYASCGYAGDPLARTPNIDRLAAQGTSFSNAVSSTPVCSAFRASLLTGKYTTSTGMVINELRLSPDHECFGHVLSRGGYQTAYIGKWHLWANQLGRHDDDRNAFIPPGPYRLGFDGHWAAYNFHHIYHNAYYYQDEPRKIRWGGKDTYEPDAQTDMAIDWMTRASRGDEPFALFLSWGTPHDPWGWDNVPKRFADRFRNVEFPKPPNYKASNDPYADGWARFRPRVRAHLEQWQRAYYAMTANLDWNLGRLLKALGDLGVADDT